MLWLAAAFSVVILVSARASDPSNWNDPSWWTSSGAVKQTVVTNQNGITPEGGVESAAGHAAAEDAAKAVVEAGTKDALAPGAKSAAKVEADGEEMVTVYRGVSSDHLGYEDALKGKANPIGGHSDPALHNEGNTNSEFTSWTTDKSEAYRRATTSTEDNFQRTHGVMLEDRVPASQLVKSPDNHGESEVLRKGPVSGATVISTPNPGAN
jgi:hypothetical protein